MKVSRLLSTRKFSGVFPLKVLLLCVFFALGILLGGAAHSLVADGEEQQLREYLLQYAQLAEQAKDASGAVNSSLVTYLRYPLMVMLCGFMALGVVLIPTLCLAQGFFLSFAVHAFASAIGQEGVNIALCALGMRCLFTVPLTLFLAMHAITASVNQLRLRSEGRRKEYPIYGSAYWMRFVICVLILLVGVVLEISVVPDILGRAITSMT